MFDSEQVIIGLIGNAGDAKNHAIEAIHAAKIGDFDKAEKEMDESTKKLNDAHNFQTQLLKEEAESNKKTEMSLLVAHGQDHLMNAITARDFAEEIIDVYKLIYKIVNNK